MKSERTTLRDHLRIEVLNLASLPSSPTTMTNGAKEGANHPKGTPSFFCRAAWDIYPEGTCWT